MAFIAYGVLDFLFHEVITGSYFLDKLAHYGDLIIQPDQIDGAVIFYLVAMEATVALVLIALLRLHGSQLTPGLGARIGALIGVVGSVVFNFANGLTFHGWPLDASLVDIAGHVVSGAIVGWLAARVLIGRTGRVADA